jgi:hypothetical protein
MITYSFHAGQAARASYSEEKVDLVATKATRQNKFACYLTIVGVQCKVRES